MPIQEFLKEVEQTLFEAPKLQRDAILQEIIADYMLAIADSELYSDTQFVEYEN